MILPQYQPLPQNITSKICSVIGPGGLAAETPGGEAEGGVWRCRPGGEEEAVWNGWRLCTSPAEEPALEATSRTGKLPRHIVRATGVNIH